MSAAVLELASYVPGQVAKPSLTLAFAVRRGSATTGVRVGEFVQELETIAKTQMTNTLISLSVLNSETDLD